ncbi:hypothetical protein BB558_002092 [Smittium angustum]|uniref:Plasma membrane ATPase n=1 Tax=Smittium angustum TaxID=133377 RepID=A0A2U1J9M6_SMIAN|nr:hypothetical protein BB558_002092 [Smittium angustum]
MNFNSKETLTDKKRKHEKILKFENEIPPELEILLNTNPTYGLTAYEHAERLEKFGRNEIKGRKRNPFLHFFSFFTGSIAYLIEIALILTGITRDWVNFGIILLLLFVNAFVGWFEESKAESTVEALKNTLAIKTKVWRSGNLIDVDSSTLVPGDIIIVRLGDIVPADAVLLGIGVDGSRTEVDLMLDQAGLTGESLPVVKTKGDTIYSSSIVKQGQMTAVVVKTGTSTFIGKAASLISLTDKQSHFQKTIEIIGNILLWTTVIIIIVVFSFLILKRKLNDGIISKKDILDTLEDILIFTISAIPIGLPTVLSVTMTVGSKQLAKKHVIVKRLAAVEEMASISVLCSDKTGTLTLNELTFDKPFLKKDFNEEELLFFSYLAAEPGTTDPIELAVRTAATTKVPMLKNLSSHNVPGYKVVSFLPFNPSTKMTQATIKNLKAQESFRVAKGAPQVIINLCGGDEEATDAVNEFAYRGLRALGVAINYFDVEDKWMLVGMISLLDPPRPDSAETIARREELGISVKMITGDQQVIAKEVARRLGMQRTILDASLLINPLESEETITERCIAADGFAHVIPEHKFRVVELLQNKGILVAMTGDGVNDAPALKKANVGIAVHGCTDAARAAADIVLLKPGLSTIIDGILTSRAIFQRMRSYTLHRIASTVHFLLFFFFVTLWLSWQMSSFLLILISILNDAATIIIALDNSEVSQKPDKWRIGQLITLSVILGVCLCLLTFGIFFVARDIYGIPTYNNLEPISGTLDNRMQSIIYLNISSAPMFQIFFTRLTSFFFKNLPSLSFFSIIMATQLIATIICSVGIEGMVQKIGFKWGLSLLAISRKLQRKKEKEAIKTRVSRNVSKVRNVVRVISMIPVLKNHMAKRRIH